MTRGRRPADIEADRETFETALANLGNARVLVELVHERVSVVAEHSRALEPAIDDLRQIDKLIKRAQRSIAARAADR